MPACCHSLCPARPVGLTKAPSLSFSSHPIGGLGLWGGQPPERASPIQLPVPFGVVLSLRTRAQTLTQHSVLRMKAVVSVTPHESEDNVGPGFLDLEEE